MEGLNPGNINNIKFNNPYNSSNDSNLLKRKKNIIKERDLLNNNIDYEKYKKNFYTFKEFKCYNKRNNFLKLDIPHYSFYEYFNKSYYINEHHKSNLLKEIFELKKNRKKLQIELNRAKKENITMNKYIKTLEDEINENRYNISEKNIPKTSNKNNFNYKEYKNKFELSNKYKHIHLINNNLNNI